MIPALLNPVFNDNSYHGCTILFIIKCAFCKKKCLSVFSCFFGAMPLVMLFRLKNPTELL